MNDIFYLPPFCADERSEASPSGYSTLEITRVMILADPIKLTDRNFFYGPDYPLLNRGNDLGFKFSITKGKPGHEFTYEVEAFCLNFKYENFLIAKRDYLSNEQPSLVLTDVFEWTDDKGIARVSLFISDDKLLEADNLFYTYVDTKDPNWPPSRPLRE